MNSTTVWRIDLDTDTNTWDTRAQFRCKSQTDAENTFAFCLANPPAGYETVSLVADCRLVRKQMLTGDQEVIS